MCVLVELLGFYIPDSINYGLYGKKKKKKMNPYELIRRLIALVVALINTPHTDELEIARLHAENSDLLDQLRSEKDKEAGLTQELQDERAKEASKDAELGALVPDIENALTLAAAARPPTPAAIDAVKETVDAIDPITGELQKKPIDPTDKIPGPQSGIITSVDDPRHPENEANKVAAEPPTVEETIKAREEELGRPLTDEEKATIERKNSLLQEKIAAQEKADQEERAAADKANAEANNPPPPAPSPASPPPAGEPTGGTVVPQQPPPAAPPAPTPTP